MEYGNAARLKVYTSDIGLLVAMLDNGSQADILKGNLLGYKGAIFDNLIADFLCKSEQKLYYFHKDSGLELDFLVRYKGECIVLEVKAKTGKAKSLTTVLKNKPSTTSTMRLSLDKTGLSLKTTTCNDFFRWRARGLRCSLCGKCK